MAPDFDRFGWERYRSPTGRFRCLAVSRDGAFAAIGCGDTCVDAKPEKLSAGVLILELNSGEPVSRVPGQRGTVYAVEFSPDARHLAALDIRHASSKGVRTLRIMERASGVVCDSRQCAMHDTRNWSGVASFFSRPTVRWRRNGEIVSSEGVSVARWHSGVRPLSGFSLDRAALDAPPEQPEDRVVALEVLPERGQIVLAGGRRGLRIVALSAWNDDPIAHRAGRFAEVAVDRAERFVAVIEADDALAGPARGDGELVSLYSALRPKRVRMLNVEDLSERWSAGVDGNVQRLAFSPDGRVLYGADASGARVRLLRWEASSGAALPHVEHPSAHRRFPITEREDWTDTRALGLEVVGDDVLVLTHWQLARFRGL